MERIVISGINLFEAGPLSIFYDCLDCIIDQGLYKNYKIIAFVHKKELFEKYVGYVSLIELPKSRNSYIFRLYYEYIFFNRWSKGKKIDVWLSLHDITPNVNAKRLYTYCHNPSPFMKKDLRKIKYSFTYVAFSFLYKYLYRINIHKANAVIVQQEWIRNEFKKMFPVRKVIVAKPNISVDYNFNNNISKLNDKPIFIFSSYPRFYKNFEVICKACKLLENLRFEVWLTLDGSENSYSKDLVIKYGSVRNIKWLGLQTRDKVFELYNKADYLLFPSLLETWGLPISEFKCTGKGVVLADLPYAHETLGNYDKAVFFNPQDEVELSRIIKDIIENDSVFQRVRIKNVDSPYAENWVQLFDMICD